MLPGGWKEGSSHLSLNVPLHTLKPPDIFAQAVPLGNGLPERSLLSAEHFSASPNSVIGASLALP